MATTIAQGIRSLWKAPPSFWDRLWDNALEYSESQKERSPSDGTGEYAQGKQGRGDCP